jgi:hypothetical protein
MTNDEFQRTYHEWQSPSRTMAESEAATITLEDGSHPIVVGLPFGTTTLYCLMLPSAAAVLRNLFPETRRS